MTYVKDKEIIEAYSKNPTNWIHVDEEGKIHMRLANDKLIIPTYLGTNLTAERVVDNSKEDPWRPSYVTCSIPEGLNLFMTELTSGKHGEVNVPVQTLRKVNDVLVDRDIPALKMQIKIGEAGRLKTNALNGETGLQIKTMPELKKQLTRGSEIKFVLNINKIKKKYLNGHCTNLVITEAAEAETYVETMPQELLDA